MSESPAPDLRRQAGPHAFVVDLDRPTLDDGDRHHLQRVLRLRDGDPFTVSDAKGSWRAVTLGAVVEPTGPIFSVPAPPYSLGLGVALTKAAKPEFAVQKATELGLDEVVFFAADRSVVRWDEAKRAKNLQRLQTIAREAAMQSRRTSLPEVSFVASFAALASRGGIVRADFGGAPVNSAHRFVVIGPEGGWSPEECLAVPATVDLGPTVLRAETAAVTAGAYLARFRG